MKRFSWVATILLVTSMILGFVGCKEPPIEPTVDKIPPAEVTSFYVTIENGSASLSWVNPSDTDFAGVQISMIPAEGILVNPISLGKDATSFTVPGLEVDCTYRFTIKTFDNSQNYSKGATQIITIENNNPSQGDDSPGDSGNDNPSDGGPSGSTDTTAPAQVTNLSAVYDVQTLQIAISWTNPQDEDFAGTVLEYGKTSSTEKTTLTFDKSYSSTVIQGIAADDSEYVVYVKTKDSSGNVGEAVSTTVQAINDIIPECDVRTGDYVLSNNTYVRQEYFSELTQEERDSIVGIVLVPDSGVPVILGIEFPQTELMWTTIPSGIDTYFADISIQVNESSQSYSFSGDLDGSNNWKSICLADPSGTTNATTNYPVFYFANMYAAIAGLMGTDYADGWYVPSISELWQTVKMMNVLRKSLAQLEKNLPYVYIESDDITNTSFWSSSQSTSFDKTAYRIDYLTGDIENVDRGTNSSFVWVFHEFDVRKITKYNNYQGYPSITSIEVETAGEGYTGDLLVTITGENLKGHDITCSDVSFGNVNYISNTKATATITCDGIAGKSQITITTGTSSASGNVVVIPSSSCITDSNIGNIVLSDGRFVSRGNFDSETMTPIAVIVGSKKNGGQALAVGLERSSTSIWAKFGTPGYYLNFMEIQGTTTQGDMDGSDNWDYICSVDPMGTQDAATNYPIFNFANTYGERVGLTGTDYEDGWYIPTIAELDKMYENESTIQSSLSIVGTFDISSRVFWSSSQDDSSSEAYIHWGLYTVTDYKDHFYRYDALVFKTFDLKNPPSIYNIKLETSSIGETYTGTIPVTITGKNLLAYGITSQDSNLSNINYISNTEATAEIDCNNSVGSHLVTINCGTAIGTATYNVIEAEKCFAVGDILFTDGTRMKAEDVQYGVPEEQISKALGIIASTPYGGVTGKAVGLQRGTSLQWAPSGTTGCNTNFTEIQSGCSGSSSSGYTFTGDLDGSDNWDYICSIDPTGTADAATNYPAFNFANTYGTTAGLTGTDYEDGWYLPAIAELYDVYTNRHIVRESLSAVGGADTIGVSYYWSGSQYASYYDNAYDLDLINGNVDYRSDGKNSYNDVLVLQAFNPEQFNNYEIAYEGTNITSVKVASAGEGYTRNLLVTIEGTNLKDQNIICSDASFSNLTYISNKLATATITCNGTIGTSYITVTCGSSSRTGTVKVLSSANCFTSENIGDIVLSDGSFVAKDNFNSSTMTPIAVVVGVKNNGGQAVGVGLQRCTSLQWASSGTTGYNTNFTEIQGTKTGGDMDGSDNWAEICKVDPEGTVYPVTNYPAFNFANTYGITAGLTDTDYKNGWYLPSIAELDDIYDYKSTIQSSLTVAGGFTIGTSYYWSSSQYASNYKNAFKLDFYNGYVDSNYNKSSYGNVLVLQAFNAQ